MNLEAVNRYHLVGAGLIGLAVTTVVFKTIIVTVTAVALAALGVLALWIASRQPRPAAEGSPAQPPRALRRPPTLNLEAISRVSAAARTSPSVHTMPRSAPLSPPSGPEEFRTPREDSAYVTPQSSLMTPPGEEVEMHTPRERVEPEKITVRECVLRLAALTRRYENCDESEWPAFGQKALEMINSLEDPNPFHVQRELRRLRRDDPNAQSDIVYLDQERLLKLFPQEPQNIRRCILSLDKLNQITSDDSRSHVECLQRICIARGLNELTFLKEVQRLYKTDEDVRKAIDRLSQRADLIALMQHGIDTALKAVGVTQEGVCEFLIQKDYVGLVERLLKSQPLIQLDVARSKEWLEKLDELIAKIVSLLATTWSAQLLWPQTLQALKNLFHQVDMLYPQPAECIERFQTLYQTNPAIKKQIDGLLHPGYLNLDSGAKKKAILFLIQQKMDFIAKELGISQEDAFGLLKQRRYTDLAKRVLANANPKK